MRSVDEAGRLRIIEMMWELVYADGSVSEFEDNIVWRAADLLGISSRDRVNLKHRVADSQADARQDNVISAGFRLKFQAASSLFSFEHPEKSDHIEV